jgi:hypothetical protein
MKGRKLKSKNARLKTRLWICTCNTAIRNAVQLSDLEQRIEDKEKK